MAEPVPPADLIGNAAVRELCGGVSRHTLIAWRREQNFPAPVATIDRTDVWDRRQVKAWLKERERVRRAKQRSR